MFLFDNVTDTIYLKYFYNSPFTGDHELEAIRSAKVMKVIKKMGDKYVLAKPIKRKTN